jgi:hypothetical protein
VGAGVGVEFGVGIATTVGAELGVGGAVRSDSGVALGVEVAVGAVASALAPGAVSGRSRGGLGRSLAARALPCAPAAANVVAGDSAWAPNSPNVEPTGEPSRTIEPTPARRAA